jgi:hypothetical protein
MKSDGVTFKPKTLEQARAAVAMAGCRSITKLGAEWFIKEYTAYHKETP